MYGWVGSAYLLASTVTVPVYGKLADLYGRRPLLLLGIALFLLGSIACGLATSVSFLVAARVVQGLGAGGMQPIALTVVGDLFKIEERGRDGEVLADGASRRLLQILHAPFVSHAPSRILAWRDPRLTERALSPRK